MIDKDKQVEELINDIDSACSGLWYRQKLAIAEALINIGYCKLHKDNVVLTKEELNKKYVSVEMYELAKAFHDEKCAEFAKLCYDYNKLTCRLEQVSKEITEKILTKIKNESTVKTELVGDCDEVDYVTYYTIADYKLKRIAKQPGVEIKENKV